MKRKISIVLLALLLVTIVSGCSNNGSGTEEVVDTTIDTIAELNNALNSSTTLIEFAASIGGDALLNNRTGDLILDLKGNTLTGNLEINQPANDSDWSLTITSTEEGGVIDGDLIIDDPGLTITNEVTVTGTTSIINAANNSFNNNGTLNDVGISDLDGISFYNGEDASISGELEINLTDSEQPVVLRGNFGDTTVTISGDAGIVYIAEGANISNIIVNADNCSIKFLAINVCDNINFTGTGNNLEYVDGDDYTISGSGYQEWETGLNPVGFAPVPGVYEESQTVIFGSSYNLDYYYTIDGSEPTRNSASSSSIAVDESMTIKVKGYSDQYNRVTPTTTAVYTISNPPVITITGVEDAETYIDSVTPVISADQQVSYDIELLKDDSEISYSSGQTISDIGEYQLTVTATNQADDSSTEIINFTITRATVSGQITFDGGIGIEDTTVAIVSNSNLDISSYDELSIVAQTYADATTGSYQLNGISAGTYYVVAYKEVNGSDQLEFVQVEGETDYKAVEPNGAYGDEQIDEPIQLVVDSPTITNINIPLAMETNKYDLTVNVFAPFTGNEGENINEATVTVYGTTEDVPLRNRTTDVDGNVTFDDLYGGYYYVKVEASGYHNTFTAINPIMCSDSTIYTNGVPVELSTVVFTDATLKQIYDIAIDDPLGNYGYFMVAIDADKEDLYDQSIAISPAGGTIGYMPLPMSDNPQLNFGLTAFPSEENVNKEEDTYIAGIKGISQGSYKVGLSTDPVEERLDIEVEDGRFIFFEPLEYILE